jgi:hypothetical protein
MALPALIVAADALLPIAILPDAVPPLLKLEPADAPVPNAIALVPVDFEF